MEAMASSMPVITTPIGGIPELVENGFSGLFVPYGDVKLLAQTLIDLAQNPELRRKLGENARQKILKDFNLSENVKKLLELMKP